MPDVVSYIVILPIAKYQILELEKGHTSRETAFSILEKYLVCLFNWNVKCLEGLC